MRVALLRAEFYVNAVAYLVAGWVVERLCAWSESIRRRAERAMADETTESTKRR